VARPACTAGVLVPGTWDVEVLIDKRLQPIEGFGACFSELVWQAHP